MLSNRRSITGPRARVGAAALAVAAGVLLPGCEVSTEVYAQCSTSPPAPHQENGVIESTIDLPLEVAPGETFTITVRHIGAYSGPPGGSAWDQPTGTISVTGPVTPSGTFSAGQDLFGGTPFPVALTFQATGQPGETIRVAAVSGSGWQGTFPDLLRLSCSAVGDATIGHVGIVAPD